MTNHENGDDDRDNNRKTDKNNDKNSASGSGSDGPIFYPIVTPRLGLGLAEEDRSTTMMVLRLWRHIYLSDRIYLPYKFPINSIVNMFHKLMYAKIGVLDLCC